MGVAQNTLSFQYLIRGAALEYLHGPLHAEAIEQRDAELEDYLGRHGITPWVPLVFLNSWANYSGPGWVPAAVRRNGDVVEMRGLIARAVVMTAGVASIIIPTLPVSMRPAGGEIFGCLGFPGPSPQESCRVDVSTTGNMSYIPSVTAAVDFLSLSAVRYSVTP